MTLGRRRDERGRTCAGVSYVCFGPSMPCWRHVARHRIADRPVRERRTCPMPLDGITSWHPNGWTIRVAPAPRLSSESRHWPSKKRRAFHKLALAAAYAAIDAIQLGLLYGRREDIWCRGSWIRYYFRLDNRQKHTILITISHFHFYHTDPPPPGPHHRALPIDPLVLQVSGSGRRYKINRIEGIAPPLPQPPARNLIVSVLDALRLRGKLQVVDMQNRGNNSLVSPVIERIGGQLYYSPRRAKTNSRFHLDIISHNQDRAIQIIPKAYWLSQLGKAFKSIQIFRKIDYRGIGLDGSRATGRLEHIQVDNEGDPVLSRMTSGALSASQDLPLNRHDLN